MAGWEKILTHRVVNAEIANDAVDNSKIANDAVDGSKIANDSINSEHYVDGSIDTAHIANGQITTDKIEDEAVTGAKIESATIESGHLEAGIINDSQMIADDVINSQHYANGSIDTAHIADGQITTAKLASGAVDRFKIGSAQVRADAIAPEAVEAGKLGSGAVDHPSRIANGVVGNAQLANGAVRIGNIDTSNSSVLGYYLQASQTTEGLSWVQAPTAHNYITFKHNFSDNLGTNEHYLPWGSTGENTSPYVDNVRFVVPFNNMKFRRLVFQYESLQYSSITATFDLKSSANGSTTLIDRDTVNVTISSATTYTTYTIDDGTASSQLNYTASVGEALYFSVDFSLDPYNTTRDFYATSVWELDGNSIG